jgi:AMP-polyphosphate phosphotransferase
MFESAETGHAIDKETYAREVPALREALLKAQYDLLKSARFPVLILINGVDAAGRGETVNLLKAWMDPRHIRVHALSEPTEEEALHPDMWRFWRALPPKGHIGIFFGNWYSLPIIKHVYGDWDMPAFDQAMEENIRFERMLANEGALILKFWFHLSKKGQKKRFEKLESDPDTRWRVTERDWKHYRMYDKFVAASERAIRETSRAEAPWTIIDGSDARYRSLTVGRIVLQALQARLADGQSPATEPRVAPPTGAVDNRGILHHLDLSLKLAKDKYDKQLEKYQGELAKLARHKRFRKISGVVVFEGVDAAGKGSAIRRVTDALDARHYEIFPIAAPTEEERAQPYLWRFWKHVPRRGRIAIFDRSWYGRVLVERVEGFCSQYDWLRAYGEINDFEEQLVRSGIAVIKFWLQISAQEQLKRFKEREKTPFKQFKITPDDWRNREKWDAYETAVSDMVARTSTEIAPWTLVEAEDKRYARIKILKTLCERIEHTL